MIFTDYFWLSCALCMLLIGILLVVCSLYFLGLSGFIKILRPFAMVMTGTQWEEVSPAGSGGDTDTGAPAETGPRRCCKRGSYVGYVHVSESHLHHVRTVVDEPVRTHQEEQVSGTACWSEKNLKLNFKQVATMMSAAPPSVACSTVFTVWHQCVSASHSWSSGLMRVRTPSGISVSSAVFAGLAVMTNRRTTFMCDICRHAFLPRLLQHVAHRLLLLLLSVRWGHHSDWRRRTERRCLRTWKIVAAAVARWCRWERR